MGLGKNVELAKIMAFKRHRNFSQKPQAQAPSLNRPGEDYVPLLLCLSPTFISNFLISFTNTKLTVSYFSFTCTLLCLLTSPDPQEIHASLNFTTRWYTFCFMLPKLIYRTWPTNISNTTLNHNLRCCYSLITSKHPG